MRQPDRARATALALDAVAIQREIMAQVRETGTVPLDLEKALGEVISDVPPAEAVMALAILAGGTAWLILELAEAHDTPAGEVMAAVAGIVQSI